MQRKIDPSQLWLVAIMDKELLGEPYVAFAVVEASTPDLAAWALPVEMAMRELRTAGRGRCVPCVLGPTDQPFKLDHFYKVSTLAGVREPAVAKSEPESEPRCNGHLVHSEFVICPKHDQR